jgi:hypothetical protein
MPPKTWHPDPSWPPAPDDWKFWVDGKGNAVRGPVGRYAGPSQRAVFAGAGGLVVFLAVNLWAISAIGLFDGDDPKNQAAPMLDDSSATPSVTATPTVPPKTTAVPSPPPSVQKTTVKPTPTPTRTKTTRKAEETEERQPTPTKTSTRTPTPTPSGPPTREEILAQYCAKHGWEPKWCDPDNWPSNPPPRRRP